MAEITTILPKIMAAIGRVQKKKRPNSSIPYAYWGIEDVVPKFRQALIDNRCFLTSEVTKEINGIRETSSGGKAVHRYIEVAFYIYGPDGLCLKVGPVPGEAMDSGDKSANKAWTCALKNALKHLLMIETETSDPDHEKPELAKRDARAPRGGSAETRPAAAHPAPTEADQTYGAIMMMLNRSKSADGGTTFTPVFQGGRRQELKAEADAAKADPVALKALYERIKKEVET